MTTQLGVISGYLGAGKTTLINRLLAGALPGRTGVVINDFGTINIDADLVTSASQDTVELTNGCVCCQITEDVAQTMTALASRTDLDRVICEVSGVGDPRSMVSWQSYPGFSPGPVLVCADSTAIQRLLRDAYVSDTVERQLSSADVVLMTKTDLAGSAGIDEAVEACRRIAPAAQVVLQNNAELDSSAIEAYSSGPNFDTRQSTGHPAQDDHTQVHETRVIESLYHVNVTAFLEALRRQSIRLVRAKGTIQDRTGQSQEIQLSSGAVDLRPRPVESLRPRRPAIVLIAAGPNAQNDLDVAAAALIAAARAGSAAANESVR